MYWQLIGDLRGKTAAVANGPGVLDGGEVLSKRTKRSAWWCDAYRLVWAGGAAGQKNKNKNKIKQSKTMSTRGGNVFIFLCFAFVLFVIVMEELIAPRSPGPSQSPPGVPFTSRVGVCLPFRPCMFNIR